MLIWLHSYERTSAAKLFSSFFIVCSSLVELCDSIGNSKFTNYHNDEVFFNIFTTIYLVLV